jgi:hypothetical protein
LSESLEGLLVLRTSLPEYGNREAYRGRFSNTSFATGIAENTFGQPT